MKLTSRIKNIDWQLAATNDDDDFHTDIIFLRVATNHIRSIIGAAHPYALLYFNKYKGSFFFSKEHSKLICNKIITKSLKNTNWLAKINQNVIYNSDVLMKSFSGYTHLEDFAAISNHSLLSFYKKQLSNQINLYRYAWIQEILQTPVFGLTDYLFDYLRKITSSISDQQHLFYSLTTSKDVSIYFQKDIKLAALAKSILHSKHLTKLFSLPTKYLRMEIPWSVKYEIENIRASHGYLIYHGYGSRVKYCFDDMLELLKYYIINPTAIACIERKVKDHKSLFIDRYKIINKYNIPSNIAQLFEQYGDMGVVKQYRKLAQLKNFYFLDKLLEEISFRFKFSESIIHFMTPEEIINQLSLKYPIHNTFKRNKEMIYFNDNGKEILLSGNVFHEIKPLISIINKLPHFCKNITGIIACPGHVTAPALVINRPNKESLLSYPNRFILISREADPDLYPLIIKASAVVTDQGGSTCHVATICREYQIPCITGTQCATSIIENDDIIEVDAHNGNVTIITKQSKEEKNDTIIISN